MAWTEPRTWVTSELVTASQLNTHVRDNFNEVFRAIDRSNTVVDVSNTASYLSLEDGSVSTAFTGWTIPAGVMGAARGIRLTVTGDALYNNSDADDGQAFVLVGGTTLVQNASLFSTGLPSSTREGWQVIVTVWNLAANSQIATLHYTNNARAGNAVGVVGTTLGTADTTSSWQLDLVFHWTAASTNLSFRRRHCVLELI